MAPDFKLSVALRFDPLDADPCPLRVGGNSRVPHNPLSWLFSAQKEHHFVQVLGTVQLVLSTAAREQERRCTRSWRLSGLRTLESHRVSPNGKRLGDVECSENSFDNVLECLRRVNALRA